MIADRPDSPSASALPWLAQRPLDTLVVFRALQLGDMLCAVPALRALRAALPHTRITLAGLPWAEQFAARFHRYVDEFVAFPGHPAFPEQPAREELLPAFFEAMQARRFDAALQLHGSGQTSNRIVAQFGASRSAGYASADAPESGLPSFPEYRHSGAEAVRLLRLVTLLGAPDCGASLEFPLTDEDRRELQASGVAAGLETGAYVCVHPGARMRDKCWPPRLFAEVADRLAEEFGVTIVLTGSGKERDLADAVAAHMRHVPVNAAAPISIGAMAALMAGARLLVCNDTGVSHIAAGLRLPSVVIFSKADIERWAPLDRQRHRCLWDPDGLQAAAVLREARELLASPS